MSRKLLDNFHYGSTYQTICELAVTRLGFDAVWIEPVDLGIKGEPQEKVYGISPKEISQIQTQWEGHSSSSDWERESYKTIDDLNDQSEVLLEHKSFATFPLAVSGEKIGAIKLLSKDKNFFTNERIELPNPM